MDEQAAVRDQGYPVYQQLWLNWIWSSGEIFDSLRIIKRLLIEEIDINELRAEVSLQKRVFVLSQHIGIVFKHLLTTRFEGIEDPIPAPHLDYT